MNRRSGLGRGLAALIPLDADMDAATNQSEAPTSMRELSLSAIVPNERQPRQVFDDEELLGLAASIEDMGLLQPIVVRPTSDPEMFELIAGERRLRASKIAGLETIPALIRQTEDTDLLKEALVENIHRVQLNPLEEAAAYGQLLEDFGFTQVELAKRLGKSRPAISNSLRLLGLPQAVQRKLAAGVLSAGHAKALLALDGAQEQESVADKIVSEGMSVRATEELVRIRVMNQSEHAPDQASLGANAPRSNSRGTLVAPALVELQEQLSDALDAKVRIGMGKRSGKIVIQFQSISELERLVGIVTSGIEAQTRP
jgi:ParB family chromosome partitioning protein